MGFDFESFTDSYIDDLQRTLSQVSRSDIEALWSEVEGVDARGGRECLSDVY